LFTQEFLPIQAKPTETSLSKRLNNKFVYFFCGILAFQIEAYDPHSNLTKDNKLPKELQNIGFSDITGRQLDTAIPFQDTEGKPTTLSQLLSDGKPVILSPVYYKCPTLCNVHMNGVLKVLKQMDWTLGKEFNYVAFSFNPQETNAVSSPKRLAYLQEYGRPGAEGGMTLLTGKEESIVAFTRELDFRYTWDEESEQYIHASGIYVLTKDGKVSRIFQGIDWNPTDLKLALIEASYGQIGNFMDKFALFCFQFDPKKNKYTIYAYRMMQIGGALTLIVLGTFLYGTWRKSNLNTTKGVH